ncbi:DUF1364 domain-containing protein [Marinobacterium jannaschii]|uniref:DUF1364 domain-containing protein n=1 Tax=Marinobacterium jannaschii TaxID=64970 RepID=UPI001B80DFC2|nr:DUF1364 domain-containing protein [Marinobacterium jannaschii]
MIRSEKLRESAQGQECTLQIAGVCNSNPETTVLAHLPDESHGMALKADDISAAFSCSDCHDCIDGRHTVKLMPEDKEFYMRRAQTRTMRMWVEMGLVVITGAA